MKNKFRYTLIVLFLILLIIELLIIDYDAELEWKNIFRIISPVLMVIAMILSIRQVNKHSEN